MNSVAKLDLNFTRKNTKDAVLSLSWSGLNPVIVEEIAGKFYLIMKLKLHTSELDVVICVKNRDQVSQLPYIIILGKRYHK